jgi:hypothetical protein
LTIAHDFGYPPEVIGRLAQGRLLQAHQPNIPLDNFIVNYAICWPIIAACSIRRMHDGKFAEEYIIPQILLQWLMRETMCDGIRFFSTRMSPGGLDIRPTANYVFPALPPPDTGHSQKLRNIFEMTDPCMWSGMNFFARILVRFIPAVRDRLLATQFQNNQAGLAAESKAPL